MISFNRLKEIREDNDLSQEMMGLILGVKRSTYSLWELGINIMPLNYLANFADYFNISLDYILSLSDTRSSRHLVKGLDLKTLGNNMKAIRIKNNLSQENIANMLGVSQACINKYENGKICISLSNLYKFAKEFNCTINELCGKMNK
jgi:transcriptional regulator with XRE-family HTH domain